MLLLALSHDLLPKSSVVVVDPLSDVPEDTTAIECCLVLSAMRLMISKSVNLHCQRGGLDGAI